MKMDVNASAKSAFSACLVQSAAGVATGEGLNRTVVRSYSATFIARATGIDLTDQG